MLFLLSFQNSNNKLIEIQIYCNITKDFDKIIENKTRKFKRTKNNNKEKARAKN